MSLDLSITWASRIYFAALETEMLLPVESAVEDYASVRVERPQILYQSPSGWRRRLHRYDQGSVLSKCSELTVKNRIAGSGQADLGRFHCLMWGNVGEAGYGFSDKAA